jgi:hypothetical protein
LFKDKGGPSFRYVTRASRFFDQYADGRAEQSSGDRHHILGAQRPKRLCAI